MSSTSADNIPVDDSLPATPETVQLLESYENRKTVEEVQQDYCPLFGYNSAIIWDK